MYPEYDRFSGERAKNETTKSSTTIHVLKTKYEVFLVREAYQRYTTNTPPRKKPYAQ